jgi:hypothetical protein
MKYGSGVEGTYFFNCLFLKVNFRRALTLYLCTGISTVEPEQYARRFLAFIADAIE